MADPYVRALNANALVTWEEALEFLSDITTDDKNDVVFLINSISDRVQYMTGRLLKESTHEVYLNGLGGKEILLPDFPVSAISLLKVDATQKFDPGVEIASSDFVISETIGLVSLISGSFPVGYHTVYVEYTAGYNPIPAFIQEAVFETIQWSLARFRGRGVGMESQSADGVTVRQSLSIPASAWNVFLSLKRYI